MKQQNQTNLDIRNFSYIVGIATALNALIILFSFLNNLFHFLHNPEIIADFSGKTI